jgi:hypothetical protein
MKKFVAMCLGALAVYAAATTVFWTQGSKYSLTDNPGPNLAANVTLDEGRIVCGTLSQYSGSQYPEFLLGNGSEPVGATRGFCAWAYVQNLKSYKGAITSAKLRGEYWDWYNGYGRCQGGTIKIRQGVVSNMDNIAAYGTENDVIGVWMDMMNPIGPAMGFDATTLALAAEETTLVTTPAGRPSEIDDSPIAKQFFEMDVTKQVQWILNKNAANADSSYAIVLLVSTDTTGGNIGMRSSYASIDSSYVTLTPNKLQTDAWTKDGNTMHLVVEGNITPVAVEKNKVAVASLAARIAAYPNPFSSSTCLRVSTGKAGRGTLSIFDASGKKVFARNVAGSSVVSWQAEKMPVGIYVARLAAGNRIVSKRIILIK